jgi:hypothetical protein
VSERERIICTDHTVFGSSDKTGSSRLKKKILGLLENIVQDSNSSLSPEMYRGFAGNYQRDLTKKDHSIKEARSELVLAQKKLLGTRHTLEQIEYDASDWGKVNKESDRLEAILRHQTDHLQAEYLQLLVKKIQEKRDDDAIISTDEDEDKVNKCKKDCKDDTSKDKVNDEKSSDANKQKKRGDDIDDMDKETLYRHANALTRELALLKQLRKEKTDKLTNLQLQMPSQRHQEYKRLISMCCNVSYNNVDVMLLPLLLSFDQLGLPPP